MRGDLHIHTVHSSDGVIPVQLVLDVARSMGMDVIAFTDHNTMAAYHDAQTLDRGNMIIIPAMEISSAGGHILAYGVSEEVPRDLSVPDTITAIHDAGGIAVAAHPYRWWSGLGEDNVINNHFDAIEVQNFRSLKGSNRKARELATMLELGRPGGSDAHVIDEIGRTMTIFPEGCNDAGDLLDAILSGNTMTEGSNRSMKRTITYGTKVITQWIGRGMRRM